MRIRMLRGVVGEDRTDWLPGTEHDASEAFTRHLVALGKAVLVTEDGPPAPAPPLTTGTIENRAVVPEARDPRPKARRR